MLQPVDIVKINIAIAPDEKTSQQAIKTARQIAKFADTHFYLDGENFLPHITVYSSEFPSKNRSKIINAAKKIVSKFSSFESKFSQPASARGYIEIGLARDKNLFNLHKKMLKATNPLREGHIRRKYQDPQNLNSLNQQQKDSLFKYGHTDMMELYRPHLTFTRFKDEKVAQKSLSQINWPITQMTIGKITVFLMGDHGTCIKPIKTFQLNQSTNQPRRGWEQTFRKSKLKPNQKPVEIADHSWDQKDWQ